MYLTLPFVLAGEEEATVTYAEEAESGKLPVMGKIVFAKSALSSPPPRLVRISVSYVEGAPLSPEPSLVARARRVEPDRNSLKAGELVMVVKSRRAEFSSPPEWLGQYLGRKGTVLWTSNLGAMVHLSDSNTWFPYPELEFADPDIT
jgi:hypothetical protein